MSQHSPRADDILLNAFIDQELSTQDQADLLARMKRDSELKTRYNDLLATRQWTQLAFADINPGEQADHPSCSRYRFKQSSIAAALVVFSLFGGWFAGQYWQLQQHNSQITQAIPAPQRYVIHIDSNKAEQLSLTLAKVEQLLSKGNPRTVVEVVANAGGLDLLRSDTSPYAHKISQMMNDHNNLLFIACSNAIQRAQERGESIQLIDGTVTGRTAVDEIVEKVQDGWRYIKI